MKKYQRLNEEEHSEAAVLLNLRKSIREIGKELGRSPHKHNKSRNQT
jgi:IS30 family transposase